jgi:hypothetical protein
MARSVSQPSRTYQPGNYGPFAVDGLTNSDTVYLEMTITQNAANPWPDQDMVGVIHMAWNDGSAADFNLSGVWKNRDGTRRYTAVLRLSPPSQTVTDGSISFTVNVAVECALSLVAVAAPAP